MEVVLQLSAEAAYFRLPLTKTGHDCCGKKSRGEKDKSINREGKQRRVQADFDWLHCSPGHECRYGKKVFGAKNAGEAEHGKSGIHIALPGGEHNGINDDMEYEKKHKRAENAAGCIYDHNQGKPVESNLHVHEKGVSLPASCIWCKIRKHSRL